MLSVLLTGGLYGLLYAQNPRFFFIDDRIADTLPKMVDIGRLVSAGEWPWLTTAALNSGAHAVEYQNGVFNPVLVALGIVLSRMDDMALGGFVVVLVHAVLLAGSAAWLGRLLGLSTSWSVALALSCSAQAYTVFWGAAAWLQAITSFSWFVLAVAACVAFHHAPRRRYGWLLLVATYGCYTCGWPLAIPVLGLFVLVLVTFRLRGRASRSATGWLAAWYAGGAVCSLVALYPLTRAFEFASRSSAVTNRDNFNVVSLDALLQFANPAYYGFFQSFDGYQLQQLPHFYVAWFVLPVLMFWRPERLPVRAAVVLKVAAVMLAVTALATLGPERLFVFRFPTRFLQYASFFLLVATAVVVAQGRFTFDLRRLRLTLGLVALLALLALQVDPDGAARVLPFALGLAGLCWALFAAGRATQDGAAEGTGRRRLPEAGVVAVVGTVAMLVAVVLVNPVGRGEDYRFPADRSTVDKLSVEDYTLFYGTYLLDSIDDADGFHAEYHPAGTGLLVGDRQINGYSPLGHEAFQQRIPMDDQGNFAPGGAGRFSEVDPDTGLQLLELLKVDQVIALRGPWAEDLDSALRPPWRRSETREYTEVWRHPAYTLPGLVSFASPGLLEDDQPGCGSSALRECVSVDAGAGDGGRLVFARLWFPGYTATLDGEPLGIVRHADTLVAVDVPAGASGAVVLQYRSPHVRKLAPLAGGVVLALAVASTTSLLAWLSPSGRRRRRSP